jgi:hypothetical protein
MRNMNPDQNLGTLIASIIFMITLGTLAGIFIFGAILMALGLRNAPDGYEDELGFHYDLWRNDRPDASDISCVWTLPSEPAFCHAA